MASKKPVAEYPYNEYRLYIVWHEKEGRYYAQFKHLGTGKRHCISLARYRMAVKLGRVLEKWEQVDHIDNDKTNDSIDNLQILTRLENNRKAAKYDGRDKKILVICPICKVPFKVRRYRLKDDNIPCCSRACGFEKIRKCC